MPSGPRGQLVTLEQHHILPPGTREVIGNRGADGTTADDKRFYMGLHSGLTPEGFDPWITPRAGPLQNQPDQ